VFYIRLVSQSAARNEPRAYLVQIRGYLETFGILRNRSRDEFGGLLLKKRDFSLKIMILKFGDC
jgi:hypothetical protein